MDKVIYLDEIGKDIYEDKICGEEALKTYIDAEIYNNEWRESFSYAIHIETKIPHTFNRFGVDEEIPYSANVTIYKVNRHVDHLSINLSFYDKVRFDSENQEVVFKFSWCRNKYIVIEPLKEHLQIMETEWFAFEDISGAVRYALRKLNRYWENVN